MKIYFFVTSFFIISLCAMEVDLDCNPVELEDLSPTITKDLELILQNGQTRITSTATLPIGISPLDSVSTTKKNILPFFDSIFHERLLLMYDKERKLLGLRKLLCMMAIFHITSMQNKNLLFYNPHLVIQSIVNHQIPLMIQDETPQARRSKRLSQKFLPYKNKHSQTFKTIISQVFAAFYVKNYPLSDCDQHYLNELHIAELPYQDLFPTVRFQLEIEKF